MTARSVAASSGGPSTKTWTMIVPKAPGSAAQMRAARSCRRGERTVTPLLTSPDRTSMRRRGTAHTHRPSRSASTSMVYSRPPARVCTTISPSSGRRTTAASSSASRTMATPMPGAAEAGLGDEREGPAGRVGEHGLGSRLADRGEAVAPPATSCVSCLSAAMSTTPPPDSEIVVPIAANWSRLPTHAAISVSMVGTTRSTPCFSHISRSVGTNAGSSRRGTSDALVGLVEGAGVPGGVGGDDPPVEPERRERPTEAAQQLDPPAGGRHEHGDGPAGRGTAPTRSLGSLTGAAPARSMQPVP